VNEAMTMTTRTAPKDQAVSRFRWLALWIPLAVMVVIAAIQATVIDDLTATVGTHFRADGTPDGWGPAWTYPAMTVGVGGGCSALFWLIGVLGLRGVGGSGKPVQLRWLTAFATGGAGFLAVAMVLAGTQATEGPNMFLWVGLGGVVAAGVAGFSGYRLAYDIEATGDEPAQPQPLELSVDERAVWTATTSMGSAGWWIHAVTAVIMIACLGLAVGVEISEEGRLGWVTWLMLPLTVLVVGGMPAFIAARVRVDSAGFTVRSTMGWPRIRIPLDQIEKVEVTDVDPMGEFGGWGWRQGLGTGKGVVFRAGEGLRITRANGKLLTVTMDDAATAAALLNGLKAQA
jgi:hypothetical protein